MIRSEKKLNELNILLKGNNSEQIINAVKLLRDEEPFSGAVEALVHHYDSTDDKAVQNCISDFLNDVRDLSVREEVIGQIMASGKPPTIQMLLSSCWQSGLDYSAYATDLAGIFVNGDLATAIECLTVIEESVSGISESQKEEILRLLSGVKESDDPARTALTGELIDILRQ